MDRPAANWQEQVGSLTLLRDLSDSVLLHYLPKLTWLPLKEISNAKFTIIGGEVELDPTPDDRKAVLARLPGSRLAPLTPRTQTLDVRMGVDVDAPHSATLRLLPNLSFGKIVLSATVLRARADHDAVVNELRNGWLSRTLIAGHLRFECDVWELKGAYSIVPNARGIRDALATALQGERWARVATARGSEQVAQQALGSWIVARGPAGDPDVERAAVALVAEWLHESFFSQNGVLYEFDSGQRVPAWVLRHPAELGAISPFVLERTASRTLAVDLLS